MKFGLFGDTEHRVFNYKPIYYDPEKEERRQMFGHVDGTFEKEAQEAKEKGTYVPGSSIRGSFRGGNYARKRGGNRAQSIIGLVGLIMVVVILIYFSKFFQLL